MIKDRFSVQLDYKTVIKKSQKDLKQAKSDSISNSYNSNYRRFGRKTLPLDINKENETSKISPGKNIFSKKENNISINNLENSSFNLQEEKLGVNYLEISKKNQKMISYINIDLFLQKIAQDMKIYDDMVINNNLLNGFCIQHPNFIATNTLISKIIACFNYFYTRYLHQDIEKEINKKNNVDKKYQLESKKTFGYRSKYKQNKKPEKEIFDSLLFVKNLKKIPYGLIDLLILFIELHDKYSKETLTKEILDKIEKFYKTILDIYDIRNNYKNVIDLSIKVLNGIKNRAILRRTKSNMKKIEYEKLFSNKILLENKLKDPNEPFTFFNVLDYNSKDIAKELTRITYQLFSKIQPKEFFKGVFTKKNKKVTSPNITEVADRFNQLSFWLIEEILSYDHSKDRAKVIEKFIDIGKELINLNNFNDGMSVVSGLGMVIINNLLKTWKYVSKQKKSTLQNLQKILNFQDNYKNIRDKINECLKNNLPYIPFLGLYNKRICFLEEYGPYIKNNSLINVDKIVLVQEILDQFYEFTKKQYNIIRSSKNEFIIFQCLDPAGEDELNKLSSFIEPNFLLKTKKTHEKRITNTEKNFKENYEKMEELL